MQPGNRFETPKEYFNFIASELGHPRVHHHFEEQTIESDGIELHLDIYDYHKDAPTIVFIPGAALYALCYSEILFELGKRGYNIIGFDPRGHGQSGGSRGDYTVEELMRDAENVTTYAIDRYNEQVSLFGSSQGGIVALYMAAKDRRLKSVICQNIADLTAEETIQLVKHPKLFKLLKPLLLNVGKILPQTQVPVTSYINLEAVKIKYFGSVKEFLELDPLALKTISMRALRSMAETPPPRPIEEIITPVMVLTGSEDNIFPLHYTMGLYEKLTCTKSLEVYEGLDHALLHEDVEVILPPIVDWLFKIHGQRS